MRRSHRRGALLSATYVRVSVTDTEDARASIAVAGDARVTVYARGRVRAAIRDTTHPAFTAAPPPSAVPRLAGERVFLGDNLLAYLPSGLRARGIDLALVVHRVTPLRMNGIAVLIDARL